MVGNGQAEPVTAFPLQWPAGRKRARWRKHARFGAKHGLTLGKARDDAFRQIKLLGGKLPILSSNLELRLDGLPYANQRQPDDPGVAVYFMYKGTQHCFACDEWHKVEDNVFAIAKTIDALRGIERWGTGDMLERAFQGFQALPNPAQWWHVLGFDSLVGVTRETLEDRYKRLAMQRHPDRGGTTDSMAELNWARDKGYEHLGTG